MLVFLDETSTSVPNLSIDSSAEALLSDPEISNSELNSMQSEFMKTSDEVENIEGGSQSSEELGKNNAFCYLGTLYLFKVIQYLR